jgi:hypothetical protein
LQLIEYAIVGGRAANRGASGHVESEEYGARAAHRAARFGGLDAGATQADRTGRDDARRHDE